MLIDKLKQVTLCFTILFASFFFLFSSGHAAPFKVLVVMSYEEDFPWCEDIKSGIEKILSDECIIHYFYMNTKSYLSRGGEKAKEAFSYYQSFNPDGVIAADDNAQSMFVVPYLREKVDTPVMFCGVNAEPDKYGYPAGNVSGILERLHFNEAFSLAQQLVSSIKTVGFINKESPTGRAHIRQLQREAEKYTVVVNSFQTALTVQELIAKVKALRKTSDALYIASLAGILDRKGNPLSKKEGIKMVIDAFGDKPTIGDVINAVEYGALCSVIATGQEQGEVAAKMLLQAMNGVPVKNIPVAQNQKGERIINATVMRSLALKIRPEILRGAKLVKTIE